MIRKHIKIFTLLCDNLCLRIAYGLVPVSVMDMDNSAVIVDMRCMLEMTDIYTDKYCCEQHSSHPKEYRPF